MGLLRRLLGIPEPQPAPAPSFAVTVAEPDGRLAVVTVGNVSVNAAIYEAHQRDVQDWSSGVRIEDPRTGRWLISGDHQYPDDFRAAGARAVAVAGVSHHADAQSPAFETGQMVQLIPEPTNPVDPRAIAIRSADGRLTAGYVPAEDLDRLAEVQPPPRVGLVVWENFTWRPRVRLGLRLLIGPNIRIQLVPEHLEARERVRRATVYQAGREAEQRESEVARQRAEAAKLARAQERAALHEQRRVETERRATERDQRAKARAAAAEVAAMKRAAAACVECGGALEPHQGRGRRPIRCATCRSA